MENFDSDIFSFFENDLFIQWVTKPDDENNAYWKKWMQDNPGHAGVLLRARQMAQDLATTEIPDGAQQLSENMWDNIHAGIQAEEEKTVTPVKAIPKFIHYWVAASAIGLLFAASAIYYFSGKAPVKDITITSQKIAGTLIKDTLKRTNSSLINQIVYLVDGTKVTLQPGSSVKHTVFLQKDKREVYLDGDAFFEVAKDANRPFYVYAHDIVLRVLGTSFKVTTNKNNGNITVLVRTGKVSVYKNTNRNKAEFILTPNEGIHYTAQTQSIVKSVPDTARIAANIKPEAAAVNFNFEETPVAKIFTTLENAYGIKIDYKETVFSKCIVTTSLGDEPFEEKLKIICAAINAKYTLENNEVSIEGSGCK